MSRIAEQREARVNKMQCPHCGSPVGTLCYSQFLNQYMVNEIHRERWGENNPWAWRRA